MMIKKLQLTTQKEMKQKLKYITIMKVIKEEMMLAMKEEMVLIVQKRKTVTSFYCTDHKKLVQL